MKIQMPASLKEFREQWEEVARDAERYRWLRDEALDIEDWSPAAAITDGIHVAQCLGGSDLDEEIDTAMQEPNP